jgi:hypothetical protein
MAQQGNCRCKIASTEIRPIAELRAQVVRYTYCTCGQVMPVAIRKTVILFMASRGLNTADCHDPRYTFERGAQQETVNF